MTRICNFPISETRHCRQPMADDKPNCGRHRIDLSAEQLGQNPTVYQKNGELHIWAGEPDDVYCLIHGDPAYQALCQVAGETPPCCPNVAVTHWDSTSRPPHLDNGHTVIETNGTRIWYRHYRKHREDGPALISMDGTQEWWQHGERHRDDGPAIIESNGTQYWYQRGACHCDGGPAVIWPSGTKAWYQHGELHREDGPAVIGADGTQEWWQHDGLHREDGPTVIKADGTQKWYQRDQLHREDGPAMIKADGTQIWFWYGEEVTEEEHAKLCKQSKGV